MKKTSYAALILIIAVLSFLAGGWYGKNRNGKPPAAHSVKEALYYVDPMNPGFRSQGPGIAPCGMPLEPVYAESDEEQGTRGERGASAPGAVQVSLERQQLIGVVAKPVELQPMTYSLRLYGKIVPDETRIFRLNASTDSWVRSLSKVTTGGIVRKNQLLAKVLAPAFYNAQVTYLVALDNVDRIMEQLGGQLRHQQADLADNQIRVAVQALQNLGISDAQVERLANTRQAQPYLEIRSPTSGVVLERNLTLYQWFKAGEDFYSIADLGKVWVYADVYEDEAVHLRPGQEVKVSHPQLGQNFTAKVGRVLPLFDSVAKTLKVRLDIDNRDYDLRPDMFVDVEIPITMQPSLHVPADAVIDSGTRKIVYVSTGTRTFEPRVVETGWRLGRQVEITGGLMPGEKVIFSGNFLIDSESRMKTAAMEMPLSASKDPVCRMTVNEQQAEAAGRSVTYAEAAYYFCSDKCRDKFEKQPARYAHVEGTPPQPGHESAMEGQRPPGWLAMLTQPAGGKTAGKETRQPAVAKEPVGSRVASPGVIDWNGKDRKPREWRSGWGKFPGAEYLGLKEKMKKMPAQPPNEEMATHNANARQERSDSVKGVAPSAGEEHPDL